VSVDVEALQVLQIVTKRYRQGREPFRRLCLNLAEALEIESRESPRAAQDEGTVRLIQALRGE
jgi:hypothetical protein